jgi:hypothetical protein
MARIPKGGGKLIVAAWPICEQWFEIVRANGSIEKHCVRVEGKPDDPAEWTIADLHEGDTVRPIGQLKIAIN